MKKTNLRVPIGLPIAVVVLVILGLAARAYIQSTATEEQLNTNVLLSAIPFILIFVAIILAYITLIVLVSNALSGKIPVRIHKPIESLAIAGILLGIFGMFQPWVFRLYQLGFYLLLFSLFFFILWSHVQPKTTLVERT